MSKKHRKRQQQNIPREGHELRRVIDWARHLKNGRLAETRDSDELDLSPRAEVWRDGDLVAIVFMVGDRDKSYRVLHGAIVGYGADEVLIICDAYGYSASSEEWESRSFKPGQLAEWFHSPDPAQRALVTEALICGEYKRHEDGSFTERIAQVGYAYDPKKHKFQWSRVLRTDAPEGDMHSCIVHALKAEDGLAWVTSVLGDLPPDIDAQLIIDINVTKHLVRDGGAVMYRCKDEATQDRFDEAMKDEPNIVSQRKTIRL